MGSLLSTVERSRAGPTIPPTMPDLHFDLTVPSRIVSQHQRIQRLSPQQIPPIQQVLISALEDYLAALEGQLLDQASQAFQEQGAYSPSTAEDHLVRFFEG